MLHHLDDDEPFVPTASFRASVQRRASAIRRRRRIVVASCALTPLLAVAGFGWYVDSRLDRIERVDVVLPAGGSPSPDGVVTILALGTDGAELLSSVQERPVDYFDSIVVVRIDATRDRVDTLVIPRDLWTGTAKINSLPRDEMVAFVGDRFGIHPDHVITLTMEGIVEFADVVGLEVEIEHPVRDRSTGLALDVGCHEVAGSEVLAYLRSRHLEEQSASGEWVADPTGDIGRMTRGQAMVAAAWPRMLSLSPSDALGVIDVLAKHVSRDAGLTNSRLVELFRMASSIEGQPSSATLAVQPATSASGASVLVALPESAAAVASVGGVLDETDDGDGEFTPVIGTPEFGDPLGMVAAC